MRILIFILGLLAAATAEAQGGAPFELRPAAISGGGGLSEGGDLGAHGTVGQPSTTASNGESFSLIAGFWPAPLSVPPPTTSPTPTSPIPTTTVTAAISPTPTSTYTPTQSVPPSSPTTTASVGPDITHTPVTSPTPTAPSVACVGDCDGDGTVTVDEIVRMISIALGTGQISSCEGGDSNGDRGITVDEIVAAVGNALDGCVAREAPPQ